VKGRPVDIAFDGEGLPCARRRRQLQVILLDRDLPKIPGDDVCRRPHRARVASRG